MNKLSTQCMVVFVGPPGCGKSTLAAAWCQKYENWVRICQDELGCRKKCERFCKAALRTKKNVIIDRCNFDDAQRKTWIKISQDFNIRVLCLQFKLPTQTLKNRILLRLNHPHGVAGSNGLRVLEFFLINHTAPSLSEGFENVLTFPNDIAYGPSFGAIFWRWIYETFIVNALGQIRVPSNSTN